MTTSHENENAQSEDGENRIGRRSLLTWLAVIANGVAAALVGVPAIGYLLKPWTRRSRDRWVEVGAVESFVEHETRFVHVANPLLEAWSGASAKVAMYVRREPANGFTVFAVNCTHLECPVAWFPESGLFLCPCHGGVYNADGTNVAGPPPRPLYRYPWRIDKGKLLVQVGHLPTLADPA